MTNETTIRALEEAIRRLDAAKREIEKQRDALVTALRYFEDSGKAPTPPRQRTETSVPDAIEEILSREGPLGRGEIHKRLVEQGVHVGGRDPVNNVGARLRIDTRFKNVDRDKWDLVPSSGGRVETERADGRAESDDVRGGFDASQDTDDSNEEDDVAW